MMDLDFDLPGHAELELLKVICKVLNVTTVVLAAVGALAGVIGICVGAAAQQRARRMVRECEALIQGAVGSHGTADPRALRDIGIIRYDALNEMSGQMSFSFALLNATGDGVVVSSINGREQARTYAKTVREGKGVQELSPEEREAVSSARTGTGLDEGPAVREPENRRGIRGAAATAR
jgi:uncharacterized protein YjiS (DUF1127 family)